MHGSALFVLCVLMAAAGAGAPAEREAGTADADVMTVLTSVLRDRGEAGWDLETRCKFLRGGGFSKEEARFVIEAFNVYARDAERLEEERQTVLKDAGFGLDPAVASRVKQLEEKRVKLLESLRKDLSQVRGGAMKQKLDALLFLMKRGVKTGPSNCQERIARLLTYTAMSETADGRVAALALTVSTAWSGHQVQAKTVLRGPGEGIATRTGDWGRESAAAAWLAARGTGLYVGESEHYESCANSNLTKMAGATRGTKYAEPAERAALN
jgi:hypothetical protein